MFIVGQFNSWQVVILVAAVLTNDVLFPLFSSSDVGLRTRSGPNVRRFPQHKTHRPDDQRVNVGLCPGS